MACRTLRDITKDSCLSNKGGLFTKVWLTNRSYLTFNVADQEGSDSDVENDGIVTIGWVEPHNSTDMHSLAYRKQSSGLTSEGTFDDANGVSFFTNNLALVFARQDTQKRMAIQALALQEDLAVIVADSNHEIYFLGYDDSVTTTAAGAQTGTAATDANQYTITLTDISNELPYMVDPDNLKTLLGLSSIDEIWK